MEHIAYITKKPELSGVNSTPDGAFCGNGDVGAVLGNSENGARVYVTKCDFWIADERGDGEGGISPLAVLDIDIPEKLYNNYYAKQHMDTGELILKFRNNSEYVNIRILVCAQKNALLLELSSNLTEFPKPQLKPLVAGKAYEKTESKTENGVVSVAREIIGERLKFTTSGVASLKRVSGNETRKYIISVATNHDSAEYIAENEKFIDNCDENVYNSLLHAHFEWWQAFYEKSSFELSDKELENAWYAAQYTLAVCARNKKFPHGLYGNFIAKATVNWKGDYHLNYNYQAPFYALFSSNHTELSDCYIAPLEDFAGIGKEFAKRIGKRGIYYPVGIGPGGMCTEKPEKLDALGFERLFLGQKSNAVHAADILIFRWNATRDTEYAREHIYPYLKLCADFWESYLVKEDGVYNVYTDAVHEVPYYKTNFNPADYKKDINAKNNLLTLGLLRMLFKALIDISEALGEDENRREKWSDILINLAPFPTQRKKFKRVFRYTEKGMAWKTENFLCLQHVYPCNAIDFKKDKDSLKIAVNTFKINNRWDDDNASSSIYPCAVRIGILPELIIDKLKANRKKFLLPNMLLKHGGGCLENSPVAATVLNEMALSSETGVVEFFPHWDNRMDCTFTDLRADGAFLVSAEIKGGEIAHISVTSEKGSKLTFKNPYKKCTVNGKIYDAEVISVSTVSGEKYVILKVE